MTLVSMWIARIVGEFGRARRDRELAAELEAHLEMQIAEEVRRGLAPADARRRALAASGGVEAAKDAYREQRGLPFVEHLRQDLSYGIRTLRRSPTFTAVAVLSLGLGIGANTAVFSVVNGVILRPLPFEEPHRLVQVYATTRLSPERDAVTWRELEETRRQSRSFESLVWYDVSARYLRDRDGAERLMTVRAERPFFSMLGVAALVGRTFRPDDPANVAVVGEAFWRRRFGGNVSVIGRVIDLDGQPFTIIGVMPAGFQFPYSAATGLRGAASEARTDVWWPADPLTRPNARLGNVTGRLRANVPVPVAERELTAIVERLPGPSASASNGRVLHVAALDGVVVARSVRRPLVVLLGAVGIVLVLACANVTNLSLVRMTLRSREVAVRAALGAGRDRLARQFLTESLLVAFAGGLLGLGLAWWGTGRLMSLVRAYVPRAHEVGFDGRVFLFLFAVCAVAGVTFGLAPALMATRTAPQSVLQAARSTMAPGLRRLRDGLVTAEVSLAFVLAIGASVLIRELVRLRNTNTGMETRSVVTFHVGHRMSPRTVVRRYYEIADRVSVLPGVQAAGFSQLLPLQNWGWSSNSSDFMVRGQTESGQPVFPIELRYVTPGYFQALGIGFRGRSFTAADDSAAPPVIMINETLARRYFGNADPIGTVMNRGTIVGVVRDVRQATLDTVALPEITFPIAQNWSQVSELGLTLVVRTRDRPELMIDAVRAVIRDIAPDHAIFGVRTMEGVISDSLSEFTLYLWLIAALGGLALVLAATGTYGVVSYVATSRVREFAIRAALGADSARVRRMMLAHGLRLASIGLVVGLGAAFAATPLLRGLPVTVRPPAVVTVAPVALIIALIAVVAGLGPAIRASRANPMTLLRDE